MLNLNGKMALAQNGSKTYTLIDGTTGSVQGSQIKTYAKVVCGTGNTAPTVQDYCLANADSDLSMVSNIFTMAANVGDDFIATVTTTYQNNTANDITISEIAIYAGSTYNVMIAREVITPVTIAANGGQKTFTITIG